MNARMPAALLKSMSPQDVLGYLTVSVLGRTAFATGLKLNDLKPMAVGCQARKNAIMCGERPWAIAYGQFTQKSK